MMKWTLLISMILFVMITERLVKGQELLFKNFARSNRASRGPDEFEKFFLKASKSVPRIGRRDFETESSNQNRQLYLNPMYDPEIQNPKFRSFGKKFDPEMKDISWYDLADKVEYYPEILIAPGFLTRAGFKDMDFANENKRMDNAQGTEPNKEITEYRLQPES